MATQATPPITPKRKRTPLLVSSPTRPAPPSPLQLPVDPATAGLPISVPALTLPSPRRADDAKTATEGSSSPRSRVAGKLSHLRIGPYGVEFTAGGTEASEDETGEGDGENGTGPGGAGSRKRQKHTIARFEVAPMEDGEEGAKRSEAAKGSGAVARPLPPMVDPVVFRGMKKSTGTAGGGLERSYPSINRLSNAKSRSPPNRRRGTGRARQPQKRSAEPVSSVETSTESVEDQQQPASSSPSPKQSLGIRLKPSAEPPAPFSGDPVKLSTNQQHLQMTLDCNDDEDGDEEMEVFVDEVRAALTWRDDEITIYDPLDSDDDGTGINGIGFRPSAQAMEARAAIRRRQLTEYRRREESEARASRMARRGVRGAESTGGADLLHGEDGQGPDDAGQRRVRFVAEKPATIFIV